MSDNLSWVYQLGDIPRMIESSLVIKEYDKIFQYKRVIDPLYRPTNKFKMFGADIDNSEENLNWYISDRYLTKLYKVVSLKQFIDELSHHIEINNNITSIKDKFTILNNIELNIDLQLDDESKRIITKLLFGHENLQLVFNSTIGLMLLNSYDGSKSFRMDFSINNDIIYDNDTDNIIKFKDYFTLYKYKFTSVNFTDVSFINNIITDIKNNVNTEIEELRNITDSSFISLILNKLAYILPKTKITVLDSIFSILNNNEKNLYNLLLCLSIVEEMNPNLNKYYSIRRWLDDF